jgi:ribonuclease R
MILECFRQHQYKPLYPAFIARRCKLKRVQLPEFNEALRELQKSRELEKLPSGEFHILNIPGTIKGILKRTPRGSGFVLPEGAARDDKDAEYVIAPEDIGDAHTGDEVLIVPSTRNWRGRPRARILRILTRSRTQFVGTLIQRRGKFFVQLDGQQFPDPFPVDDISAKNGHAQDKVVVEMLKYPSAHHPGEVVITNIIGAHGDPGVDTQTIIHEFTLRTEFPADALDQAREQAILFEESSHADRTDLTHLTIVTIDPIDARDFDDAISLSKNEKGHWVLGVHVADVAHFAPPGSPLDNEAKLRGTSVYLPNLVIPMFPELLSNGLASLQAGKLRYAKTVFIEYDQAGRVVHTEFARSLINVTRRFAYEQVYQYLEKQGELADPPTPEIGQLLKDMYELAMLLRKRRYQRGMLELSLPEVKLVLNEENQVTGALAREHNYAHEMIEEFMVAANIAVAQKLFDLKIRFLRRTHAEPDAVKLLAYGDFVRSLGFELDQPQSKEALQALLVQAVGSPFERPIHYGLLRSMKQAEYSPKEIGHFALSAAHYCHFTSPIRRYPDLTVHRLIDAMILGKSQGKHGDSLEVLTKLGNHCSKTERNAERAERELKKIKMLALMKDKVGLTFPAFITGVERFGIFCELNEVPVEGLVPIDSLPHAHTWDHYAQEHSLISRRTGQILRLGEPIEVKIISVDERKRIMELELASIKTERTPAKSADQINTVHVDPTKKKSRSNPSSHELAPNHPFHKRKSDKNSTSGKPMSPGKDESQTKSKKKSKKKRKK